MSRDSKGGCELYEDLFNHNVCIEFLKEDFDDLAFFRGMKLENNEKH